MRPSRVDGIASIWHLSPPYRCLGDHGDQGSSARPPNPWCGYLGPDSVLDIGPTTGGRGQGFSGQVNRRCHRPVFAGIRLVESKPVGSQVRALESSGSSIGEPAPFDGCSLACVKLLDGLRSAVPSAIAETVLAGPRSSSTALRGSAPVTSRIGRP